MSDNWIVQNLNSALNTWNEKLAEIWTLLTQSPESFKGGDIWSVITGINGALTAIGYGLLVLFFAAGIVKTCGSFTDMKKPEHALKAFIRFALAQGAIMYGMELMTALFSIVQGIVSTIMAQSGMTNGGVTELPAEIVEKIEAVGNAGIHSLVDRDLAWKPFDYGAVLHYDPYGIWKDVQAVYVHCHCAYSYFHLCGRTLSVGGKEFYQVLCRSVSGRGDHCIGLHYLFRICCQSACSRGYLFECSDHCVELYRRVGV